MQININGRGAFLGAFAAIALAALTAAQLPTLSRTNAGGGYMGLMNPGRELWRFSMRDQYTTGPYTVPQGKELIICGMGSIRGYGFWEATCLLDGEELAGAAWFSGAGVAGADATSTSWFPGLLAPEGSVVELQLQCNGAPDDGPLIYGYLRDL